MILRVEIIYLYNVFILHDIARAACALRACGIAANTSHFPFCYAEPVLSIC